MSIFYITAFQEGGMQICSLYAALVGKIFPKNMKETNMWSPMDEAYFGLGYKQPVVLTEPRQTVVQVQSSTDPEVSATEGDIPEIITTSVGE